LKDEQGFESAHDIDLLITGENIARRFREFVRRLMAHGIRPFCDLDKRPTAVPEWNPCNPERNWNFRTFSNNCSKGNVKEFLLDIFFDDDLPRFVPEATVIGATVVPMKKEDAPPPIAFNKAVDRIRAELLISR
jgi:hypothetical protein